MKTILLSLSLVAVGCSHFQTSQTDTSYEKGQQTRSITTRASATTLFDAQSNLAKFRASQTDKTQSASVGSLNESSSSTNLVEGLKAVRDIAILLAKP